MINTRSVNTVTELLGVRTLAEILADNLRARMARKPGRPRITQAELARRATAAGYPISQTAVGLYLRPDADARQMSASGRRGSPRLAGLEAIAAGLGCEPWELLRPAATPLLRIVEAQSAALVRDLEAAQIAVLPGAVADVVTELLKITDSHEQFLRAEAALSAASPPARTAPPAGAAKPRRVRSVTPKT